MQPTLDEPARKTVRRLVVNNWDPTNTASYDPTLDTSKANSAPVHFGNHDADLGDPQVTLLQPQGEFTVDGSRWSGKNMATGEMTQRRRGVVTVQCWASEDNAYNNSHRANSIVDLLRKEVERVMGLFDRGPTSGANAGVIDSFSTEWNGAYPNPQEDDTVVTWQSQVTVTYDWDRQA